MNDECKFFNVCNNIKTYVYKAIKLLNEKCFNVSKNASVELNLYRLAKVSKQPLSHCL